MNENQIFDTVIIGGGLAGLTAAALLAWAGKSVIVLEKAATLGGRGGTTEKEGCMLNYGPHALYKGTAALRVWNELGVLPDYVPIAFKLVTIVDGKEYRFTSNPLSMMMSPFMFLDKIELAKYFGVLKKTKPAQFSHMSARQFVHANVKRPRVRWMVEALMRTATYAADLDLIGADAAIGQLQSADTLYVHGGWQTIADQLRRRAVEYGAVIRESSPVKAITGRFPELSVHLEVGVDPIVTRTVLSTAGPRETAALIEGVTGISQEKLFPMPLVPVKAACLDIALSHLPNPDAHFAVNLDDPYYYSVHSKVVSLSKDPSHHVIHVMKYLSVQEPNDPQRDKTELTQYMDRLQPGWERHVLHMRYLPQITVSYALPLAEYGGLGGRPDPAVDRAAGLYAAGDWIGSEGMLVNASVSSAEKATRYIMEAIGAGAARKFG